jgi:hypothetical protein
MPGRDDGSGNGLITLAGERVQQLAGEGHVHPWPASPAGWREVAGCELCGLAMLKLFVDSPAWVIRRVEHVAFIDECTVRRRVSIDYVAPQDAVAFRRSDGQEVRVLPLAIMRRKSLVKFDFRSHDGHAVPLLGLRQNQAMTLAVARAWAAATLQAHEQPGDISDEIGDFLDDVVAGDQIELWGAFKRMWAAPEGSQLRLLGKDNYFRTVLDRLANSFVLYGLHEGPCGERRLIKFSYDEPLTLRYADSTYEPFGSDGKAGGREKGDSIHLSRFCWSAVSSAMGFSPTRIEFPVPAAELAGSFHFEITAPPEVSIVNSVLLAGRPKPESPPAATGQDEPSPVMKDRGRRRPSFDAISGGYPTVDLHVADVPYGARSCAHVEVEARATGWFATAAFSSWLASGVLGFAAFAKPQLGVGSTLLMSFAAGLAVLLVRQDPHRLVTRLLSKVRLLATLAAVLALAAAVVMAAPDPSAAYAWLLALFIVGLIPTILITGSWSRALARSLRGKPRESPWEHHRPRKSKVESAEDPDIPLSPENCDRHEKLAQRMEIANFPYDLAYCELGFSRPAIRVASSEGGRHRYLWDKAFAAVFGDRLEARLRAVAGQKAP